MTHEMLEDNSQPREAGQTSAERPSHDATSSAAPLEFPEDALIIIPVRNLVLFPGMVVPVAINRERSLAAAQEAARSGRQLGIVLQKDPQADNPTADDLYDVGTLASLLRYV